MSAFVPYDQMEQLKAFSIRANLEREECLEKERALARERVDDTLKTLNSSDGVGAAGVGREVRCGAALCSKLR